VLDKTGTLTEGQPRLTDVLLAGNAPWTPGHDNDLLRLVAPVEHGSAHPLAAAIVQATTERGLTMAAAEGFAAVAGKGVTARVGRAGGAGRGRGAALRPTHRCWDSRGARGELAAVGKTPMPVG
jgi:Cu+-exporting ATPase